MNPVIPFRQKILVRVFSLLFFWNAFTLLGNGFHPLNFLLPVEAAMALEKNNEFSKRVFKVKEVLDGKWPHPTIEVAYGTNQAEIKITDVDAYSPPPKPKNPDAIHMILAFQMALGKGRADFAEFKKLDAPWVASNNGSNAATYWTERTGNWVFAAFEDVVFASKEDFNKAYAGNDELGKAAEGLFDGTVLVAIVEEE